MRRYSRAPACRSRPRLAPGGTAPIRGQNHAPQLQNSVHGRGRDASHCQHRHRGRAHRPERLDGDRRDDPGGKKPEGMRPGMDGGKGFGRVATPGSQTGLAARVAAYTPGARFLAAISLPSGFATASRSVAASTVRAPDDHAGSESCTPRGDALQRRGRVQRHLDQGKASPDQFTNMGQRLFRADAPQDSHQRTGPQHRCKHEDQISPPRFAI